MSDTYDGQFANDPFVRHLARLTPDVDMPASRSLFERSRGDGNNRDDGPRWWLAAAAAALVVGGVVGLWAFGRDDAATPVSPVDVPADDPASEPATDEPITEGIDEGPDVVIEPTGITVPLPPVGEPAIHNTSVGLVWVVAHDDGSVSVLPATVDAPANEDDAGVTNLATLVVASDTGRTFMGGPLQWDASGRAINGGRSNDLVGYAGRVDGDEVEIVTSTATRVPGDVEQTEIDFTESYLFPDLGQAIDVSTFYTLSSSGPIWRHFDAALVVEDGVGRICGVDTDVPVDQLATCDDAEFVLDTEVTSTQPEITTWYPAPILAFQDPIRQFTTVIPLGGSIGLNTAGVDQPPPTETTTPAIAGTEAIPDPVPASEWSVRQSDDGLGLRISFPGQEPLADGELCTAHYFATVEETDDAITIQLWADLLTEANGEVASCAVGDHERTVTVPLDSPIGGRRVESTDGTVAELVRN